MITQEKLKNYSILKIRKLMEVLGKDHKDMDKNEMIKIILACTNI